MEVRPAMASDALAVSKIHVESWRHAYRGLIADSILDNLSVENRMRYWISAIESGSPHLQVAETGTGIAGWVAFGPSRDEDASSETGEIEAIYILPEYWGQGIGKNLLSVAKKVLKDRRFSSITLWVLSGNDRAKAFYIAQGFKLDSCPPKVNKRGDQILEELRFRAWLS